MKKLSGLILLLGICTSYSQVLYNINFDGQPANEVVQTGPAPNNVTSILDGSPTVVPSFGGLMNQPLRLNMSLANGPSFYYDQIQLDMPQIHPPAIDLSFDFTSSGLVGSRGRFAVTFDTPTVRNIEFNNQGTIFAFIPPSPNTTLGSFADGETFHFGAHLDLVNHQMSVFKNGVLMGTSSFSPENYISDIRFIYGLQSGVGGPDSGGVGIDNILVVAVPEPASLSLVAAVLGLVFLRKKLRT
jgi:hypothetical protein